MKLKLLTVLAAMALVACAPKEASEQGSTATGSAVDEAPRAEKPAGPAGEAFEIAPGLTARILRTGEGRVAAAGDLTTVHYTGWLFDDTQPDNRGQKFDSSLDRGQPFRFLLGAGGVIQGWDRGVEDMAIGEKRELTIAPEMGYGDSGAGSVIPPGATLVFEVELLVLTSLE